MVVTHHGPHPAGVSPRYKGNSLNAAFFSDLRSLMPHVDLWVHGHTHDSVDIQEGRCRVVCNPRGYPLNVKGAPNWEAVEFENKSFNPQFVVEV